MNRMKFLPASFCFGLFAVSVEGSSPSFIKRILRGGITTLEEEFKLDVHPHFRRRHGSLVGQPSDRRQNEQDFTKEENCDQALLTCLPEAKCAECFRYLYGENVDWGTVTPETSCDDVLEYLAKKDYCADMHADKTSSDAFCKSFNACAVWEADGADDAGEDSDEIDCSALTECDWPGMSKSFLGDGICQDSMAGCYNTAVCDYDGGDCCEDTCKASNYVDCGHDGFVCRNPNSTNCDSSYTLACEHDPNKPDENNPDPAETKCSGDETKFRLVMYDSFGDGWDQTAMTITPKDKENEMKFSGGLKSGSSGVQYICLPSDTTCIHVEVSGGEWGNEVSWEVKPMSMGARPLAAGSAPMSCDFAVGGNACENTCSGKANVEPNKDPEYKEFKAMYTCIEEKCTIQVGACEEDDTCSLCLSEEKADFCYSSETFLAVVDCTMCQCTERQGSEFCHSKLSPGVPIPSAGNNDEAHDSSPRICSSAETMKGTDAVLTFAQCTTFDQVSMLVSSYDENKFGPLDQFEACAHSFQSAADHGGHTALGCMRILANAMNYAGGDDDAAENKEAISSLAELLYHNATEFCGCASEASADCPLCASFIHIKTLLYESLDACQSLDEIDCDAWTEFHTPCKDNIVKEFTEIDFGKAEVCEFVRDGCGGAGPFPAFRRLDCDDDIPKPAWDFYNEYASACLKDQPTASPTPPKSDTDSPVAPAPVSPPTDRPTRAPTTSRPTNTPKPYYPSDNKKPYVPSDDYEPDPDTSSSSSSGMKSWWWKSFIVFTVGGVGYAYYKRRTNAFSFVRYRNTRNYAGGESEMYSAPYSGLSAGAFQPPSLPPTPSAIDGGMM